MPKLQNSIHMFYTVIISYVLHCEKHISTFDENFK